MKGKTWAVTIIAVLILTVLADVWLAQEREADLRVELSSPNVIDSLASRITEGMTRKEVEQRLTGYRQYSILESEDQVTITYRIWFGFIPPIRGLRYKTLGSVQVVYTPQGRVISSKHWVS